MRYVIPFVLLLAVLGFACGDADEQALAPTATVEPEATATAVSEPAAFDAFAAQIEAAVVNGDAQFFLDRAVMEEVSCTGEEELGPCSGRPAGTLSGIRGGVWQSDASAIFTAEEYQQALQRYFDGALREQTDEYGSGALALFALARGDSDEVFYAITTSIVDTYPSTGAPIGMLLREAHAFRFRFESGRWSFMGEIATAAEPAAADWLSGDCATCGYEHWERWE